MGIYVGTYGTKVVNEVMIRLVTAIIIALCVVSRLIAMPIYLAQMELIDFVQPSAYDTWNGVSKAFLYVSGIGGVLVILIQVMRAYVRRRRVLSTIATKTE
jgi:hypothetical protein